MGWITASSPDALDLVDHHAQRHVIERSTITALRSVPLIPLGRNPAHGDRAMLARMLSGITTEQVRPEQVRVERISRVVHDMRPALDLLPDLNDSPDELPRRALGEARVLVSGEWCVVSGPADEALILTAWAALHNARNVATR